MIATEPTAEQYNILLVCYNNFTSLIQHNSQRTAKRLAFQPGSCQTTKGFSMTIQGAFRGEKNQPQHLAARPSVNIGVNYHSLRSQLRV